MSDPPTESPQGIKQQWWYDLIWSGIFLFAVYKAYTFFTWFEGAGEEVTVWAPIAWVYHWTGKWGVMALAGLLSLVCFGSGIRKFRTLRQHSRKKSGWN